VELLAAVREDDAGRFQRLLVATELPHGRDTDQQLIRWAIDQLPFVATVADRDLRYVHVNQQAAREWNLPADEMLGKTLLDVLPTDAGAAVTADARRAMDENRAGVIETYESLTPQTRKHTWAVHNTPLTDPSGQVRGMYTLGIDTTSESAARERLAVVNEASATIGSTLDVGRTAEEMTRALVPRLADFVTVDLLDSVFDDTEPGRREPAGRTALRRIAAQSVLDGTPEAVVKPGEIHTFADSSAHVRALTTGRPYVTPVMGIPAFDELAGFDRERSARSRDFGTHSAMAIPIRARGTTLGVALCIRHRHPDAFDADDLLLAEEVTARAAVCLDNALRYAAQRATALMLQHDLLPQDLPQQAAVQVAGRYLPSDVHGGVGGDWFDVIPLSGARVALVVGDVVGRGIHASATMGRLRTAVRTLSDMELQPDELLTHLDDLIGQPFDLHAPVDGQPGTDTGATCLYAVYNPVTRLCTLARAGHPPPALVLPDGSVELVDVPAGPPLGVGGQPFETLEVELPEGSLLALYTDGLVESRDRDIDEGLDEFRRQLAGPHASLEDTCDAVLAAMLPNTPTDDVALLLARTRGLDARHVATWDFAADPVTVPQAREHVAAQLSEWGLEESAFTAELVVSELVTNAVTHASGPIRLRLILESTLICEVSDSSNTFPHMRRAHTFDEGGRGLLLVSRLSRRWGTRPTTAGKVIWADQTIPPRPGTALGPTAVSGGSTAPYG
jgi:serine phosphatase RsbU (regulator of sigma subunit)/anti-sigma regulatory factor (Ser/Thr protein kinase)